MQAAVDALCLQWPCGRPYRKRTGTWHACDKSQRISQPHAHGHQATTHCITAICCKCLQPYAVSAHPSITSQSYCLQSPHPGPTPTLPLLCCSECNEVSSSHNRARKDLTDMMTAMSAEFTDAESDARQEYESAREEVGACAASRQLHWKHGRGGSALL